MTTLKEIAQMCGVTASTVSNVLNGRPKVSEETKKRVLEAVEKTGYQPNFFAQGMRKLKTRMVGIITEDLSEFSSHAIVEAVMACCEDQGYRTILINLRMYNKWGDTWYNDGEKLQSVLKPAIRELLSIKVDGIVYVAGHCRHIDCFPKDLSVPGLLVYGLSADSRFPSVVPDDEKGGYDMTKYLISMGHKRIGVIAGMKNNIHAQKRLLGYQRALCEEGVLYDPELVRFGNWKRASGYEQAGVLADRRVTAILCMNDKMAGGAYDCLMKRNIRVGEEISITGYDNILISEYMRPYLTTMDMCLKDVGEAAAKIIVDIMEEENSQEKRQAVIRIPGRMMIRDSVKKIG